MLFCGPCLFTDLSESDEIYNTAVALKELGVDYFRCKLFGGGTTPKKYFSGVEYSGIRLFSEIQEFIPVGTEIQTPEQLHDSKFAFGRDWRRNVFDYIWIGARNSFNYGLRNYIKQFSAIPWALKRGANMSIEKLYGAHDIDNPTWIIERGVDMLYQPENAPFGPDLKGVLRIKNERPDIFEKLIVDCSHSVFMKPLVGDVYKAFKAVGVKHFMFECTLSGKSKTDQSHMLSVEELKKIIMG